MKILYLDCFSGISGDMFLGALLDAGLGFKRFSKELQRLGLNCFKLERKRVRRGELSGTKFSVIVKKDVSPRRLADIESIIQKSALGPDIKKKSLEIFRNLARAEARSHGIRLKDVHLHELSGIDSIIDIVGAVIALRQLKIDKVYGSLVRLGKGRMRTNHGVIPIPAPGTLNLLNGAPVRFTNINKELTTPTGAAILGSLAEDFGDMPDMKIMKVGYGAGSRDLPRQPNMLRAVIGKASPYLTDSVSVVETNIDDMNPQIFDFLCRKLFKAGALDVYLTPVFMKRYRPGILLTVLCKAKLVPKLSSIIFRETTTIGIRFYSVKRNKLERVIQRVRTRYGTARIKVSFAPGILKIHPEYADCERIAREKSVPLRRVYDALSTK